MNVFVCGKHMAYNVLFSHFLASSSVNKGFEIVEMKLYAANPSSTHFYDLISIKLHSLWKIIRMNTRELFGKI